jgi:translation initiation factor IF-2
MNVTELARRLRIDTKRLLEILPEYGFDIGKKAIKIDDRTAQQVMRQWRRIKRDLEFKKRKEAEERKKKERELRRQEGVSVVLPAILTVREFAEALGLSVTQVITELMKNGILANQNQNIDFDTASIMAEELGYTVQKEGSSEEANAETLLEEAHSDDLEEALQKGTEKQTRPPVIVVMGHVDHGKTKLLDTVRRANIIDTEAGGITQHIGAYQTLWKDPKNGDERALTFIDTPGHEAFTVMRSRGAKVADIAILIVAADDSVKPQTIEAIQIIKAAKLPFIVAINKIDKPTADVMRVKTDLSAHDVLTEEWGGDVPMVEISAKEQLNIDKLLDMLLLVADLNEDELQADPTIPAVGTVIESNVDKHMGPVATVLVQAGTLRKRDAIVVGNEIYGTVRALRDDRGQEIEAAGPSRPAQIIGFKVAPQIGDVLDVSKESSAEKIDVKQKRTEQTGAEHHTVLHLEESETGDKQTLDVIVKADVLGSLEAVIGSLQKLKHDEVAVKIIGKGLGNVTENDVAKANAAGATVIGFNVNATTTAEETMREEKIEFLKYSVIYDIIDWAKERLGELLSDETIVEDIGNFKTMAIFRTDRRAMTVGGRVEFGKVIKGCKFRIKRDGEILDEGVVESCQRGPDPVKEVPAGIECGLRLNVRERVEVDDVLEFYTEESKARTIVFEQ